MHPSDACYLNRAGHCRLSPGIGPVYSPRSTFRKDRVSTICFGTVFRWVRPILWSGDKAVVRETLRTCGKILTDIVENITRNEVR